MADINLHSSQNYIIVTTLLLAMSVYSLLSIGFSPHMGDSVTLVTFVT